MSSEQFFIQQSAAHGRTLPLDQAVVFFRGLLLMCGTHEETAIIRDAFIHLNECHSQLELIASTQPQLEFPTQKPQEKK